MGRHNLYTPNKFVIFIFFYCLYFAAYKQFTDIFLTILKSYTSDVKNCTRVQCRYKSIVQILLHVQTHMKK